MPDKSDTRFSFAPVRVGSVLSLPSIALFGNKNVYFSSKCLAVSGRFLAQAGPETPFYAGRARKVVQKASKISPGDQS